MLDLAKEFSLLGFLEETEEDTVTYVMDFPDNVYVTVTNDNGRTPVRAKQNLVLACYDSEGRYRWGSEFKTFMELQTICQAHPAGSPELLQALKDASKTLKDGESFPSTPGKIS